MLLFLNLFGFIVSAQTLADKERIKQILNDSVSELTTSINGDIWTVVGVKRQKIARITNDQSIREYVFDKKYQDIFITSLFPLPNGAILGGTKSNYLFYIKGKSIVQIDHHNGLNDSTILKIYLNKKTGMLELTTPSTIYTIHNTQSARRIRCEANKEVDESDVYFSLMQIARNKIRKPIQKGISNIASELDMSGRKSKYVGQYELDTILKLVKPGDILLKRDNYYLSNVGIEGFWTHSAIFIGSLPILDSIFENCNLLLNEKPSHYIEQNFPLIYQQIVGKDNLIIEAIGKGVTINSVKNIVFVDYVSAIRPNLAKEDLFKSLMIAFEYFGVPYDFLFDFRTDDEVVCSELIYNAFRPRSDKEGLSFFFGEVMGLPFVSPNDFARQFSDEVENTNPAFSFVFFVDYDVKKSAPFFATKEDFANSWKR